MIGTMLCYLGAILFVLACFVWGATYGFLIYGFLIGTVV